jgi:hypothetical protein
MRKKNEEYFFHNSKLDSNTEDCYQSIIDEVNKFLSNKNKSANIVLTKSFQRFPDGEDRLVVVLEAVRNDKENYSGRRKRSK